MVPDGPHTAAIDREDSKPFRCEAAPSKHVHPDAVPGQGAELGG